MKIVRLTKFKSLLVANTRVQPRSASDNVHKQNIRKGFWPRKPPTKWTFLLLVVQYALFASDQQNQQGSFSRTRFACALRKEWNSTNFFIIWVGKPPARITINPPIFQMNFNTVTLETVALAVIQLQKGQKFFYSASHSRANVSLERQRESHTDAKSLNWIWMFEEPYPLRNKGILCRAGVNKNVYHKHPWLPLLKVVFTQHKSLWRGWSWQIRHCAAILLSTHSKWVTTIQLQQFASVTKRKGQDVSVLFLGSEPRTINGTAKTTSGFEVLRYKNDPGSFVAHWRTRIQSGFFPPKYQKPRYKLTYPSLLAKVVPHIAPCLLLRPPQRTNWRLISKVALDTRGSSSPAASGSQQTWHVVIRSKR